MSRLYFFYGKTTAKSDAMTATVLSLCNKKHIRLEESEKDIVVKFDGADDAEPLTDDELCIYRIFEKAASGNEEVGLKQINRYVKSHQTTMQQEYQRFNSLLDSGFGMLEYKDKSTKRGKSKLCTLLVLSIVLIIFFGVASTIYYGFSFAIAGLAFSAAVSAISMISLKRLTPEGEESYAKWHAFGRFMKEFTLIEERAYPSLELWEKYLVYATAMGISKEVLKQIKIAYPQMYNSNYTGMYRPYSYLYFAHMNLSLIHI